MALLQKRDEGNNAEELELTSRVLARIAADGTEIFPLSRNILTFDESKFFFIEHGLFLQLMQETSFSRLDRFLF